MASLPPTHQHSTLSFHRKTSPLLVSSSSSSLSSSSSSLATTQKNPSPTSDGGSSSSSSSSNIANVSTIPRVDSSITPTPTSTPTIGLFSIPFEQRSSPNITVYPSAFSYTPVTRKGSFSGSYSSISGSSGYGFGSRSKSQRSGHFSRYSGAANANASGCGNILSPQFSPLIHFNTAVCGSGGSGGGGGDSSPISMSPYEQSPSRSGSTASQFSDLARKLDRLSLSSPSKRVHPNKSSEDDDITLNNGSSSSTSSSSSSSSDGDGDDDFSVFSCLSSSSSTCYTGGVLTKSYEGSVVGTEDVDDVDDIDVDDDDDVDVDDDSGNCNGGGGDSKSGHSRSKSSGSMRKRVDSLDTKLEKAAAASSKWKTPKMKKIKKMSQSMGVLPLVCTPYTHYADPSPRLAERDMCSPLLARSTLVMPPSPMLFKEDSRSKEEPAKNTVTLTTPSIQSIPPDVEDCCEERADDLEDFTMYRAPDEEHVLPWSCEDKGVYTSPDDAYSVLKSFYAGDRSRFKEVLVIDGRYDYEYNGGHIKGAVSVTSPNIVDKVHELLFKRYPRLDERTSETCMVKERSDLLILVYCEFSSVRGPNIYKIIRTMDRSFFKYPWIRYKNLFLIKGGYEMFFKKHGDMCTPCGYVKMDAKEFVKEKERNEVLFDSDKHTTIKCLDGFRSFTSSNTTAVEVSYSPDNFF